jgi:PAS domain S-box-containing protein
LTPTPRSSDHFEVALSAAGMHTWTWDVASGRVDWSDKIESLVGLERGTFGQTFDAFQAVLHPADKPAVMAAIEDAILGRRPTYEVEHRVRLPDGSIRWLACRGQIQRDERQQPVRMLGVVWDVTARKDSEARIAQLEERGSAAEKGLRQSEDRCRLLIEQAADGVFLADESARFIDVNGAACAMLGYAREELLTLGFADVFEPDEEGATSSQRDPMRAGPSVVAERRMRRKDGSTFDVEVSGKILPDGRQQAFIRDIHERKELQAQLLRADRLAALGRLAGAVAHEINNPMTYVMLNLELAASSVGQMEPASPIRVALAAAIAESRDGAERVRRIVRGLGAFNRGDDEPVTAVDVHRALDDAIKMTENRIRHAARLTKSYGATRAARAHEHRLVQVFVNLLVNAVDAISEGSAENNEIHIETSLAPEGVVVAVRDTGAGIPPEARAHLFEPFFTTKRVGAGTGLGLSICHTIVTSFGGSISVDSERGRGATFRVVLPFAEGAVDVPATVALESQARRARILIVDDEVAIARILSRALDAHDVTIALTGQDARERCASGEFDCLVCDVMMPDLSGPDLHEMLRRDGRGLEERIVFITGGAFAPREKEFLARVPNRCVEKPFELRALEDAVAAVLRSADGA